MLQARQLQVLTSSGIQSVLNTMSELCDLWLKYVDATGEHVFTSHRREPCAFCRIIRSSPKGLARCLSSVEKVQHQHGSVAEPYHYNCHAGLTQLAVPVIFEGRPIGALICGEIVEELDYRKGETRIRTLTADLGLDTKQVIDAYHQIPRWNSGKLDLVSQLLGTIGHCLFQVNNTMISEEKLKLQNSLKIMELKALQSQINPHFLFNTLNTISMLAMMEGAGETQKMVGALSVLLKSNLQNERAKTTLREELAAVDNYLFIQEKRFSGKLRVRKEFDPALLELEIPVLTLQPLVENAVAHGLEPKIGTGLLFLGGKAEGDSVVLTVEDDGLGMDEVKLQEVQNYILNSRSSHDSMGLFNVNKRLQLIYGSEYGLTISSTRQVGTKVLVSLPRIEGFNLLNEGVLS